MIRMYNELASLLNHISVGGRVCRGRIWSPNIWGPSLLGADFVRGRVCQGPSLLGAEMSRNLQHHSHVKGSRKGSAHETQDKAKD